MLFSGWEVRIVKNCDRGHSFSLYGPTLSRQITCLFFFSCGKVGFTDYKWVCLRNFVIESTSAPSTDDL